LIEGNSFLSPLFLFYILSRLYSSICPRDAKFQTRRTRETRAKDTRPFAGDSLRETIARLSSLSFFFSFSLFPSTPYSFPRRLVYPPSLSIRPPFSLFPLSLSFPLCFQVFFPYRSLFLSFLLKFFLSPFVFSNLLFFPPSPFPAIVTSACHVTAPWGFKTSTSRCPRKARTEEERAADASNGLRVRVRPFTNSTADPRTHTHARARARAPAKCDGRGNWKERQRERKIGSGLSQRKGDRERARPRERQRKRERNATIGRGRRVETKETGKANEPGRIQRSRRRQYH